MAFPSGVSTATVRIEPGITHLGHITSMAVEITPSHTVIDASTGVPIAAIREIIYEDMNVPFEAQLPHTDQDGFVSVDGVGFKNWHYTINVKFINELGRVVKFTKTFQLPVGFDDVDLMLIMGEAAVLDPISAPIPTVRSLEVGNVTTGDVPSADIYGTAPNLMVDFVFQPGLTDGNLKGILANAASQSRLELNKYYMQRAHDADNFVYVSVNGNDANDGRTPGSAKKTITAGIAVLSTYGFRGKIMVAPGTYNEIVTLANGISVIGSGSGASTIKPPAGSNAKGIVMIGAGPITGMMFEGFRIEGIPGNPNQCGIYAEATARPAPAYGDGGWWYSRVKDITIAKTTGRGIWMRGGGTSYMLPHQFMVWEMVRVFMDVEVNKEALVLSGQVGQFDWIQCEFDTYDSPPYGSTLTVPNILICPQLNDDGSFGQETNPYAHTFHTPTIQGGYKAVYATHPCSGIIFQNPHLEGFKFGFHADTGARLHLSGGGFDNVGGWGGGTGYWTNTTIGGQITWDWPAGGGSRDKTFISDTNMGSTTNIRNAPKSLTGTETSGLTKQTGVPGTGILSLEGQKSVICSTSSTAIVNLTASALPGESIFIEAFSGPLTFSTGSGLRLGGRSSITVPDGTVVQFTRLDILNNWALVGTVPGATTSVSANYTAVPVDRTILASSGASGITVTLPAAVRGTQITIKKVDSAAGVVTIATTSGQTIDGLTTRVMSAQYDALTVESNGTAWYIINKVGDTFFSPNGTKYRLVVGDDGIITTNTAL